MSKIDEMVAGYIAGNDRPHPELPACHADKSPAWKHGWKNGRDDAVGKVSNPAAVNRRRADMILGSEA